MQRRGGRWLLPILVVVAAVLIGLVALGPISPRPNVLPTASDVSSPSTSSSATSASPRSVAPEPTVPSGPAVSWSKLSPDGPAPSARQGHTWTVDPDAGMAYLFGGLSATDVEARDAALGDLWSYDLGADTWTRVLVTGLGPSARWGHAAAWIDGLGLVIVGGRNAAGSAVADAWLFDPTTSSWRQLPDGGQAMPARSESCVVVDHGGSLWVIDGRGPAGEALEDVWRYRPGQKRWDLVDLGRPAPGRMDQACWLASDGNAMVLGGEGRGGAGAAPGAAFGDLWRIDLGAGAAGGWSELSPDGLTPRSRAAAAIHADRGVVAGGVDAVGKLLDSIWTVDSDGLEEPVSGDVRAGGRARSALIDDPASERMLLFGGLTGDGLTNEVWQAVLR